MNPVHPALIDLSRCPGLALRLAGLVLAGLGLAAGSACQPSVADTSPAAQDARRAAVRVQAGPVQRTTLRLTSVQPGRLEAFEQAPLYSKISGYVDQLHVDIGDRVEQGQVLAGLWVPEMDQQLRQKEALLGQARAEVRQAQATVQAVAAAVTTARAQVRLAEAGQGRAEADYARWESEHQRIVSLADQGAISNKLVDETLNQFRAADAARQEASARVESAQATLIERQAQQDQAEADLGAAEARLDVSQAELERMKAMLQYAQIKAPFDGVITQRNVHRGHFVQPATSDASRPLLAVAHTEVMRISVEVPEMEASLVQVGDTGTVRVQALRGQEFEGQVARTSWALHPNNRTLRTEIDVPNPQGHLRPGMYANASILVAERPDVLALPASAIVRQGRETFCCCVEQGQIVRKPITLGLKTGGQYEVLSGLNGQETVVRTGANSLQDGQAVEVIGTES